MFPVPTCSQMLAAYPISHNRKVGHANTFMLLDATEIFAEVASMKTVNSFLYSAYKRSSTIKWLVGCDLIGTTWDKSISDGYPGAVSDPAQTSATSILKQIPFGCACEVDKGFLIENQCALLGISCIRPMKMLSNQEQQSKEDVALTQKVGKTRIPVEQINGQMKCSTSFFDQKIHIDQVGIADLICRAGYMMQNFKLPFIQQCNADHDPPEGRPCKAEIRWYGALDDGLIDIRPHMEFWGCNSDVAHWHELIDNAMYLALSDLDISAMVLDEEWPAKLRREHEEELGIS